MVIAVLFFAVSAFAAPVPDTGQTKCYDVAGNVITCRNPGDALYGQDGNYSINTPSYTKLDVSGNALAIEATTWFAVKDNVTGLIWEFKAKKDGVKDYNNPNDADNTYTWGDPTDIYYESKSTDTVGFIKTMNTMAYLGFSDWRTPTMNELHSLANYGRTTIPAIDTAYFPNIYSDAYWSSERKSGSSSSIWGLNFNRGNAYYYSYSSSYYAIAVRGNTEAAPSGKYVYHGNGTVTDSSSGLMWQEETPGNMMTWEQAMVYCESLNLANYSDWRLPTIKELATLVDHTRSNPAVYTPYFPNTFSSFYWSSTTVAYSTDGAWGVHFSHGYDYDGKFGIHYVRAVRGGQAGSLGNLVITPPSRNVEKEGGSTTFSVSNSGTGTMPWTAAVVSGDSWLAIASGFSGSNTNTRE
jgi:hypothetical protein